MQSLTLTRDYMNIYRAPGVLLFVIYLQIVEGTHIGITFANHSVLDRLLPENEARAYLEFIKAEAAAGTQLWLIVERAGAWTTAVAMVSDAERQLVDGINAAIDGRTAERVSAQPDVSDIVNGPRTWTAFRQAHARTGRPTSEPMDRILDAAVDGYIPRSQDATSTQLIALHRRGKVILDWRQHGRTRRIAGAWITGQQPEQVAA